MWLNMDQRVHIPTYGLGLYHNCAFRFMDGEMNIVHNRIFQSVKSKKVLNLGGFFNKGPELYFLQITPNIL